MSLAEDLQRAIAAPIRLRAPFRGLSGSSQRRSTIEPRPDVQDSDRPSASVSAREVAGSSAGAAMVLPPPDPSFDLLDRAEKSMTLLLARCRDLEQHIRDLDAWSLSRIEAAETAAEQARDERVALESKLEAAQRSMDDAVLRADDAEAAAQRDREALIFLQERIITAFGAGSDVDEVSAMMPDGA